MTISIKLILQDLIRRAWIIVLCAFLGLGGAYVYTKTQVAPIYTTTMKVSAYSDVKDADSVTISGYISMMNLAQRRVSTYIELMKTTAFYERIATVSGTGYTPGAVGSMLYFQQIDEMGLFTVTITGTDPDAIKAIGDALSQEMWPYIDSLQPYTTLTVIEPPVRPTYPINEAVKGNCVKGFLVGALLAGAVIAVIAYFDTHIKDEQTLTERYKLPVLGVIPDFAAIADNKRNR